MHDLHVPLTYLYSSTGTGLGRHHDVMDRVPVPFIIAGWRGGRMSSSLALG